MKKYLLTMAMVLFAITTLSAISLFNKKTGKFRKKNLQNRK